MKWSLLSRDSGQTRYKEHWESDAGHRIVKIGKKYSLSHPDSLISIEHPDLDKQKAYAEKFPTDRDKYAFK